MARRVGVLVSGTGTNLQALIDAAEGSSSHEITLVLSNRPGAGALARAEEAGVTAETVDHRAYASREAFEAALDARLRAHGIELVCLAGFMRVLTPWLVQRWRDAMLNIHPSLLPAFRGLDTHARALAAGVRLHGCTVHIVRTELDAGPIVAQAALPVRAADDAQSLAARVRALEHRLYPLAVALVAGGRAQIDGERVLVDEPPEPPDALFWPTPAAEPG